MYFFTHRYIAKALYRHFSGDIDLDRHLFAYGNIKPDLPSPDRIHHTLENCILTVCNLSEQLMDEDVSVRDFSVKLGEICHYLSDFFCYYHLNEEIHNRKLRHAAYELKLHLLLYQLRIFRKINISSSKKEPRRDILSIVAEMRRHYTLEVHSMIKDIEYALSAAVWICESIIYYSKYSADLANEAEAALEALLVAEGGSI